jgi:membrane protease YdiL (CAAX protease family)
VDDAFQCDQCSGALPDAGVPPSGDSVPVVAATVRSEIIGLDKRERFLRWSELIIICAVAFGGSLFGSAYVLVSGDYPGGVFPAGMRWLYATAQELAALALIWYVLKRRNVRLADLGLRWSWKDAGHAILLWTAAYGTYILCHLAFFGASVEQTEQKATELGSRIFHGGISPMLVVFLLVNPFFEELIARAYLMTGLRELTHSGVVAVAGSVALQIAYHLYQGVTSAVALGAIFLIFSLYYARTKRIGAPILAHMVFDLCATLAYTLKTAQSG